MANRSAGACPPRSLDLRENHPPPKTVSRSDRGTARETLSPARGASEGPSPTVKGGGLAYRSAGACPPRSLDLREKRTQTKAVSRSDRGTARETRSPARGASEGPSPTVKGGGLAYRSAGACPPRSLDLRENHPLSKAVSRSDRGTARDRPSPYDERRRPGIP